MTRTYGDHNSTVGTTWAPQPDGSRDGSANGPANGEATGRWCGQCSERVPTDDNGRCERCGGFVKGNPGGRAIAQRRRAELRQTMADIEADLIEDVGGPGEVTTAQSLLIRQAADLEVLGRSMLSAAVKSGVGTEAGQKAAHAYLAVLDRQHRALSALGIERRAATVSPYVVIEQAVREANDDSQRSRNGGAPATDPDEIATHATAQDAGKGDPPANGTGVMGAILQAAGVQS